MLQNHWDFSHKYEIDVSAKVQSWTEIFGVCGFIKFRNLIKHQILFKKTLYFKMM